MAMILLSMLLFCTLSLSDISAKLTSSSINDARALDALLQDYAYQAFLHPRTGVVYDGVVPSNLTGIQVSAMRLRSGSLRTRGVSMYKEFEIPEGVLEHPYVERLVLVYHNLGNWSVTYYPLEGYTYLAPVLGLLAYDASDLTAKNLPELYIGASGQPISIQFSESTRVPHGAVPKCVSFDTNGSVNLSNMLSDNICTTLQQGHFSIVVESTAPSPPPTRQDHSGKAGKDNSKVWMIVWCVLGGFTLLVMLVVWVSKHMYSKKMHNMERAAEVGEALHMTTVGSTKAPAATGTRTHPKLETEII